MNLASAVVVQRIWVNSHKLCAELLPHNRAVTGRQGNKPQCPQSAQELLLTCSMIHIAGGKILLTELNHTEKKFKIFIFWSNCHALSKQASKSGFILFSKIWLF